MKHLLFILIVYLYVGPNNISAQFEITYINDQASSDLILYDQYHAEVTYLVNKCGEIINEWKHDFRAGLSSRLLPNGLLLRAEFIPEGCCQQTSSGGLIQVKSWDNELVWSHKVASDSSNQHHDLIFLPNGNIMFLGWESLNAQQQMSLGKKDIQFQIWSEFVREIKPIGTDSFELVWEWHLKNHLIQDNFPDLDNYTPIHLNPGKIDINYIGPVSFSDVHLWHTNALDYNIEKDQILINSRGNSETWIIDHSTSTQEAAGDTGGQSGKGGQVLFRWGNPAAYKTGAPDDLLQYGSHGHYWIPSGLPNAGSIIFFNNGHSRPGSQFYSSIESISPSVDNLGNYIQNQNGQFMVDEHKILFGTEPGQEPLFSYYLSNVQQLGDGFLINEGNSGRIFELDQNLNKSWELQIDSLQVNIFRAYSYSLSYSGFQGIDLTPINSIKLADTFAICSDLVNVEDPSNNNIKIYPNPAQSQIIIEHTTPYEDIYIFDIFGRQLYAQEAISPKVKIDISTFEAGNYFLKLRSAHRLSITKFTKT